MARSPLTLAAVATSALPEVSFVGSGELGHGETGDFDSALLLGDDDRQYVIRTPTSQESETEQARELLVLRAMSEGIRSRLPFDVQHVFGQAPYANTRAVVYDYLPGYQVDVENIPVGDGVASSMGGAIANVHALPGSFVSDAGLPAQSASDCRNEARNVIERAAATGLLPAAVRKRWTDAAADETLWRFHPTVINGSVSADSFVVTDHDAGPVVTGVLGWGGLRVSDPARDLHWLSAAGDAAESVFAAYVAASSRTPDAMIRQRSMLYAELELARWLLHGKDTHDDSVVDDAVRMLDGLVDSVLGNLMSPLSSARGPVMTVADVQELLENTPSTEGAANADIAMDTDSFDRSELERMLAEEQPDEPSDDEMETGPIDLSEREEATGSARHSESTDADQSSRSSSSDET